MLLLPQVIELIPVIEVGAVGGISIEMVVEAFKKKLPLQKLDPGNNFTVYVPADDCTPNDNEPPVPAKGGLVPTPFLKS